MAALAFCCLFRFHGPRGEVSVEVGRGEVVVRERTEEEEAVGAGGETGEDRRGLDDAGKADAFDCCDHIFAVSVALYCLFQFHGPGSDRCTR